MYQTGDKVLLEVSWTTRSENETAGEITEVKDGGYTVLAFGNYFFKREADLYPLKDFTK